MKRVSVQYSVYRLSKACDCKLLFALLMRAVVKTSSKGLTQRVHVHTQPNVGGFWLLELELSNVGYLDPLGSVGSG